MKLAVVGATGLVGRACIQLLQDQYDLDAIASDASHGNKLKIQNYEYQVYGTSTYDFSQVDFAFLCVSNQVAKQIVLQMGDETTVIDNSSAFRGEPGVPLVVASLAHKIDYLDTKLIASPNCIVTPAVMLLSLISDASDVVMTTFQSLSGAGQNMLSKKQQLMEKITPFIGEVNIDGVCAEEEKITQEIRRLLGVDVHVLVTRAPISYLHHFHISFKTSVSYSNLLEILSSSPYINLAESNVRGTMMINVTRVMVNSGRASLWAISDNLYLGAAGNMVKIFQSLIDSRVRL
ncbi:Asd/ArgC dimerization domain-containing protein [Gammaproteobacteria bacterium]|nr:Asd/ArgC dimerization domain-containing protein [Gammaproteobacteria bacterium]